MTTQPEETVIQIEKLKDSNTFPIWKFQITIIFRSIGLYEIVSGESVLQPDATAQAKAEWTRKDARAQRIIITSIDKQPLTHILTCTTVKDTFKRICDIYKRDNEQQKCLCSSFSTTNTQKVRTWLHM